MFCKCVWVYKYWVILTILFDVFKQDYWVMMSKYFVWVTWVWDFENLRNWDWGHRVLLSTLRKLIMRIWAPWVMLIWVNREKLEVSLIELSYTRDLSFSKYKFSCFILKLFSKPFSKGDT